MSGQPESGPNSLKVDGPFLRAAYVEGGMSTSSIAADVGCSRATVEKYLAACGIRARGHQAGVDNLLYEDLLTADHLTQRLAERASHADRPGVWVLARHGAGSRPAPPSRRPCSSRAPPRSSLCLSRKPANPVCRSSYVAGIHGQGVGHEPTKVRADLSRFGIRPYRRPGFRETDGAWAD